MVIYYIFFILIFLCVIFDFSNIKLSDKYKIYNLLLIACAFFFGCRYNCDPDYMNYVYIYNQMPNIGEKYYLKSIISCEIEFGFAFVCSLFKTLTLPSQSIFLFCAFLTFVFVGKSFWVITEYPFSCMFLYISHFYNIPFVQIRYGVAMALILYACILLQQGKILKFFFFFLVASSFHLTALAALVPFCLYWINLSKKNVILLFIVCFILLVVPIKYMVVKIVGDIGIYRYMAYLSEESNKWGMYIAMLLAIGPFFYYRKVIERRFFYYRIILIMAIGSILLLPLGQVALTYSRFSSLLFISFLAIFSSYFVLLKKTIANWCIFYFVVLLYGYVRFRTNLVYAEAYDSIVLNIF